MLEWVRGYRRADLVPDVVAAITGAARHLRFTDLVGADAYFPTDEDAVAHLEARGDS